MSLNSSFLKKLLITAAKLLIIALVAWFVRDTLIKAWRQIGEQTWHWQPFWLFSARAIYLIGLMIVSGLPILPPVFRFLARFARVLKSDPAAALSRLGGRTLLVGWMAMILVWVFMAASLWATFRAMGVADIGLFEHGPEYIAAVSLSMVAGFLSLVPAGLGVRDLVLVELLVKLFAVNDAMAAVAGALLRLIWLVSELIISGILYFVR